MTDIKTRLLQGDPEAKRLVLERDPATMAELAGGVPPKDEGAAEDAPKRRRRAAPAARGARRKRRPTR